MNRTEVNKHFVAINKSLILNKFENKCAYCGCDLKMENMTIDHIVPLRRGKHLTYEEQAVLNTLNNMFPACLSCNQLKVELSVEEFRAKIIVKKAKGELSPEVILNEDLKFFFETLDVGRTYTVTLKSNVDSQHVHIKVRARNCKEVMKYCYKHYRKWEVMNITYTK